MYLLVLAFQFPDIYFHIFHIAHNTTPLQSLSFDILIIPIPYSFYNFCFPVIVANVNYETASYLNALCCDPEYIFSHDPPLF